MSTENREVQALPNVVENTKTETLYQVSDFEITVLHKVQDGRLQIMESSTQQSPQKKTGGERHNIQSDTFEQRCGQEIYSSSQKKKARKDVVSSFSKENKNPYHSDILTDEQSYVRRERERKKKAAYRASLTDEQRIKQREIDRQRVAAFRASLSDEERIKQKELDKQRKAASRMKKYLKREGNDNLSS